MDKIYFDNAATTKMRPEVLSFLMESYNFIYANPSAVHSLGRESRVLLENARTSISNIFSVKNSEIIFTSGATESNNLAIRGILKKTNKKEIISSKIEHSSVLKLLKQLEFEGYIVHYAKVNKNGKVDISDIISKINDDTALVCLMAVNNETGVKQDIYELGKFLKNKDVYFHVDAVQYVAKEIINPNEIGIDSMSMSAHKFYGPKGVGILYIKEDIEIEKQMIGGPQERNKRAGTENLNSILATEYALRLCYENLEKEKKHISELNNYFLSKLSDKFIINGEDRIPNILSVQIKGKNLQLLLPMLDMRGIMVSGGSACMSGSVSGSNVLKEMGLSEEEVNSSVRISLGIYNTKEEIDYLIDVLEKI